MDVYLLQGFFIMLRPTSTQTATALLDGRLLRWHRHSMPEVNHLPTIAA